MATWFITGGGRGLGAEIARAALGAGHTVAVGARKVESLPGDLAEHDRVVPVQIDVTDQDQVREAVGTVVDRLGRIDVLVNNAGRGQLGAIEEVGDAEVRSVFELNVFGLLAVTRAVLPTMRAQGAGTVVNIGSRGGFEGEPGVGIYNATKFAVAGLTEALAAEAGALGIRAMVVEPGSFRTDFLDSSSLSVPRERNAAYDGTPAHDRLDAAAGGNHQQPGDPVKAAALIVEVIDSGDLPTHLLVGRDSYDRYEAKHAAMAEDLAAWREKSVATAHDQ